MCIRDRVNSKPFPGLLVPSSLQVSYFIFIPYLGNLFNTVSSNVPNLFSLSAYTEFKSARLPSEYFKDYVTEEFYIQAEQFTNMYYNDTFCLLYTSL